MPQAGLRAAEYSQPGNGLSTKMSNTSRQAKVLQALGFIATSLWPATCVLCGRRSDITSRDLCSDCEADLPANDRACSVCAEPLATDARELICGQCLRRRPRFDAALCAFRYAYPLDALVRSLKYRNQSAHARVLGDLLAHRLRRSIEDPVPELILPVPLANGRFRERGYNQALEIGRRLERLLHIPMSTDLIVRTRETPEQAGLDRKQRRKNIRNAFALSRKPQVRHVAIVDDVITTGSTVNEIARVLRKAGVRRVQVWAVARTAGTRN